MSTHMNAGALFRIKKHCLWAALFAVILLPSGQALAATIYADSSAGNDTTGDGSSGSPYKTFHKAYTTASFGDTIDLTGTFDWFNADETGDATTSGYTISKNLTIIGQGPDQTIVQASSTDNTANRRVFTISASSSLALQDLTVQYGKITSGNGGCVLSAGELILTRVEIHHCRSTSGYGGGVSTTGGIVLTGSAIYSNVTYYGGGGVHLAAANATSSILTNNTIYSNSVTASGGAFYGGGVYANGLGNIYLTNNTITSNHAGGTYGIGGGLLIYNASLHLYLKNNFIAANTASYYAGTSDFYTYGGTIHNNGYNIIGRAESYGWSTTGDWTDSNGDGTYVLNTIGTTGTLLKDSAAAINNNPSKTKTWAVLEGSIAINRATTSDNGAVAVPNTDQRGASRSGAPDIGAYEYDGALIVDSNAPAVELTAPSSGATVTGSSVAVTASSSDDVGVSGVKFYYGATLIGSEDTSAPFSVTWDTTATSSGSKTLVAVARDAAGNVATSSAITVTVSNTPTAETPSVSRGNNSASFSWNTERAGSTKLYFGLTSSLATSTAESNTGGSATTTHSVSLSSLPKCTTYKYVLVNRSIGSTDVSTSTERTFYTACTGNATVSAYEQEELSAASGGTLTHDTLTLTVPSGFAADASSTAVFQASTLDASAVVTAVGTPSDKTRFGNIYHLVSLESDTETLDGFEEPITVELSYAGLSDVDASSLFIGRYDGSSWHVLSSTVNTSDQTVTATTSAFSDVGLFGDESADDASVVTVTQSGSTIEPRIAFAIRDGDILLAIELLKRLIAQKYASFAKITAPSTQEVSTHSYVFGRDLWLKDEGEEVKALQQYLIDNGYQIRSGVTGYFGEITRETLQKFQADKGISPASGYFGAKTRAFINDQRPSVISLRVDESGRQV